METSEKGKGSEQYKYGRVDLTNVLKPNQRRLDSFARLLAAHSECVAVAIIQGKLYITANELHTTSGENKISKSIKKISSYFSKIAQGESITPEERADVFIEACASPSRFKVSIPEHVSLEIIAKEVLVGKNPTILELEALYHQEIEIASRAYSKFTKLHKDFTKLEEALNPTAEILLPKQLDTFKKGANILYEQPKQVHAEAQILDRVVDLIDNEQLKEEKDIYIGISKLCCLNCRCLIETANKIFEEKGIKVNVLIRGNHDLSFGWNPPEKFKPGYKVTAKYTKTTQKSIEQFEGQLGFEIGRRCRSLVDPIKKAAKENPLKGVDIDANSSQSDTDAHISPGLQHGKETLEASLRLMLSLQTEANKAALVESVEMIKTAIKLYELKEFRSLHQELSKTKVSIDSSMAEHISTSLWKSLLSPSINKEKFTEILKNAEFVGKEVALYFNNFEVTKAVPSSKMEEGGTPNVSTPMETISSSPPITPGFNTLSTQGETSSTPAQGQPSAPSSEGSEVPLIKKQKTKHNK